MENHITAEKLRFGTGLDYESLPIGCSGLKDPWELGFNFSYNRDAAGVMLAEICSVYVNFHASSALGFHRSDVGRIVSEMEGKIFGVHDLGAGVVDVVLRCMKSRDASIYGCYGRIRWRHFVATGFMDSLMSGRFDSSGPLARFNIDSCCVGYDVSLCKLVFFPCWMHERWVCYAWKPLDDKWVVFYPVVAHGDTNVSSVFHDGIINQIREALG